MKLTVSMQQDKVEILGKYDPQEIALHPVRQVFIDGKRCPPGLELIILQGLDSLANEYADNVLAEMRAIGWKYR